MTLRKRIENADPNECIRAQYLKDKILGETEEEYCASRCRFRQMRTCSFVTKQTVLGAV